MMQTARRAAARMSPKHRAWKRLLDSCVIDPDELPTTLREPSLDDFIICGHSRSGTALATAALWQPQRIITVMEPWDCFRLPPDELFRSLRSEVATGSLTRGRLDVRALEKDRAVRWQRDGEATFSVAAADRFLLGVKMPAFWRYLDLLPETKFVICLRDPVEVVSSYARVGGRLSEGLDYDIAFNRRMNEALRLSTTDPRIRRVKMFDHVARNLIPHLDRDNTFVLRYERWRIEPRRQLADLGRFLGIELDDMPIDITQSAGERPDADSVHVVLDHCETAEALGYDLGRWSTQTETRP